MTETAIFLSTQTASEAPLPKATSHALLRLLLAKISCHPGVRADPVINGPVPDGVFGSTLRRRQQLWAAGPVPAGEETFRSEASCCPLLLRAPLRGRGQGGQAEAALEPAAGSPVLEAPRTGAGPVLTAGVHLTTELLTTELVALGHPPHPPAVAAPLTHTAGHSKGAGSPGCRW